MIFDLDNITTTEFVGDRLDYTDFEITAENYDPALNHLYECENGHTGAKAALLADSKSFNPNNGRFSMEGVVVYICPRCTKPVALYSE